VFVCVCVFVCISSVFVCISSLSGRNRIISTKTTLPWKVALGCFLRVFVCLCVCIFACACLCSCVYVRVFRVCIFLCECFFGGNVHDFISECACVYSCTRLRVRARVCTFFCMCACLLVLGGGVRVNISSVCVGICVHAYVYWCACLSV